MIKQNIRRTLVSNRRIAHPAIVRKKPRVAAKAAVLSRPNTGRRSKQQKRATSKAAASPALAMRRNTAVDAYNLEGSFPTSTEMRDPQTRKRILEAAKTGKRRGDARRHVGLHNELACVFGLVSHFVRHKNDYIQFRSEHNIGSKSTEDDQVLAEVLFEYTGRRDSQKKDASKYKRLLLPSLAERISVSELKARIRKAEGVHNLVPLAKKKKSEKNFKHAVLSIAESGEYEFCMKQGKKVTIRFLSKAKSPFTTFKLSVKSLFKYSGEPYALRIVSDEVEGSE